MDLRQGGDQPKIHFLPGYADEDDYPPWTWDPTSGEDLAKGTTTAGVPGHTLSWSSTKSPGAPSPATRRLPDTGEVHSQGEDGTPTNLCEPPGRPS